MRGLKLILAKEAHGLRPVASLADAWIEMIDGNVLTVDFTVASLADAWIEISNLEILN